MPRLTITLSEERRRALKEAALRRGKTIRQIIEESLEHYGIKTRKEAADLAARARAGLTETEALSRAVEEPRRDRGHGTPPPAVIDTNVVVSACSPANPRPPPAGS